MKNELTNRKPSNKTTLYILALACITMIWGLAFPLNKQILDDGNVPVFLFLTGRFSVGTLVLFVVSLVRDKKPVFRRDEVCKGAAVGAVIFAAYVAQTIGLLYTSPDKNGLLTGVYVVLIPIFKCIIGKRFQWKPMLDAAICTVGILVFYQIWAQDMSFNLGDGLSLLCALFFAIQFLLLERLSPNTDAVRFSMYQMLTIAVLSLICSLAFELKDYGSVNVAYMLLAFFGIGIFATGLAFYVQTLVQSKLKATTASLVSSLEMVFAVVFSIAFGYSQITIYLAMGGLIVVGAVISGSFNSSLSTPKPNSFPTAAQAQISDFSEGSIDNLTEEQTDASIKNTSDEKTEESALFLSEEKALDQAIDTHESNGVK